MDRRGHRFQTLGASSNNTARYPAKDQTTTGLSRESDYYYVWSFRYREESRVDAGAEAGEALKLQFVISRFHPPHLTTPFSHPLLASKSSPRTPLTDFLRPVLCFSSLYPFPPLSLFGSDNHGSVKNHDFHGPTHYSGTVASCIPPASGASGLLNAGKSSLTGPSPGV